MGISIFIIELLIAELVFLYSYPKRKYFLYRIIAGFIILPLLGLLFIFDGPLMAHQIYQFFKFIIIFIITVLYMTFCFDVKFIPLLSACVAGYTLQHLSYQITRMIALSSWLIDFEYRDQIFELIIFPFTYLLALFAFGRNAKKYQFYLNYDFRLFLISIFSLFICLVINRFTRIGANLGNIYVVIANSLYSISCCLLSLFINYNLQFLNLEKIKNQTLERIAYEEKKQFEVSKKNKEQLNIKYHDLKHVLSLMDGSNNNEKEVMEEIKKAIDDYDSEIITGNEDLDIVLNEKLAKCKSNSINFTFLGDGRLLNFINSFDIYSLFGNILDNAIEASLKIEDKSKRVISLVLEKQAEFISINCLNYYKDEIVIENNNIVTSKKENKELHGYGLKSIQLICNKYNGNLKIEAKNNIFELNILLLKAKN